MRGNLKPSPRIQMQIRVSGEELELLKKQADKHAGGNLSRWLRWAGMEFQPPTENSLDSSRMFVGEDGVVRYR